MRKSERKIRNVSPKSILKPQKLIFCQLFFFNSQIKNSQIENVIQNVSHFQCAVQVCV